MTLTRRRGTNILVLERVLRDVSLEDMLLIICEERLVVDTRISSWTINFVRALQITWITG